MWKWKKKPKVNHYLEIVVMLPIKLNRDTKVYQFETIENTFHKNQTEMQWNDGKTSIQWLKPTLYYYSRNEWAQKNVKLRYTYSV